MDELNVKEQTRERMRQRIRLAKAKQRDYIIRVCVRAGFKIAFGIVRVIILSAIAFSGGLILGVFGFLLFGFFSKR